MQGSDSRSSSSINIHQLKKRLQDQFVLRYALEKALGYKTSAVDASNDCSMPKATKELIREICGVLAVKEDQLSMHS